MASNRCQRCQGINFGDLFNSQSIPANGLQVLVVGKRSSTKGTSECDSCHFFHQFGPEYFRNYVLHVRLFDHLQSWSPTPPSESIQTLPERVPFLSVLRLNARLSFDDRIKAEIIQKGLIAYSPRDSPSHSGVRAISSLHPDYHAIGEQLHRCIDSHHSCSGVSTTPTQLPYIRLIDCVEEKVLKRPLLKDTYCTLSYVWGPQKPGPAGRNMQDFSSRVAPLTLRDAVQVIRQLGRRYLWVDRYCIDQDDEREKQEMIQNMDAIYEASELTIVALYGDNDEAGLPGVSSVARIPQPCLKVEQGCLVSSFPPIRTVLAASKWNSRGWTYQEARLSRRCLFFSQYQIYFVCRESTWSEAVPLAPTSNSLSELLNSERLQSSLFADDDFIPAGHSPDSLDRLKYSKRILSRDDDSLNAFRGLLRRSRFITFWGVPVVLRGSGVDPNVGFALGLLWRKRPQGRPHHHLHEYNTTKTSRRLGFPTWSWASVNGEIFQDNNAGDVKSTYIQYLHGLSTEFPRNEAQPMFWMYRDGKAVYLPDAVENAVSNFLPEHSHQLLIEGDIVNIPCTMTEDTQEWYNVAGSWILFDADIADIGSKSPQPLFREKTEAQALVLIQWKASARGRKKRLVLLVLNWIDEDHAERRGLLTEYRHTFYQSDIDNMPCMRKRFVLQ